ncbi:hypothetical protein F9C07_2276847 [Aspergillus flavus]|uniref:Uncharacterized protein n=1 Tax=Aspergillus flavus (strain ATCC 200026 / FGSC A1120 / IAM 13836 / NRRL 3357 / JCM 12722 / SRRC 167) TaxID=332952 RepID=A0A7U2MCZ4_ASPFN|nr:hypothetical protein F9C07_2276847 [Aspergillus flavus]
MNQRAGEFVLARITAGLVIGIFGGLFDDPTETMILLGLLSARKPILVGRV